MKPVRFCYDQIDLGNYKEYLFIYYSVAELWLNGNMKCKTVVVELTVKY